jgi:hypothetical protein
MLPLQARSSQYALLQMFKYARPQEIGMKKLIEALEKELDKQAAGLSKATEKQLKELRDKVEGASSPKEAMRLMNEGMEAVTKSTESIARARASLKSLKQTFKS